MSMTPQQQAPVIAVDIGGTKILSVIISPSGEILARHTAPTSVEEGVNAVLERIYAAIDSVLEQTSLQVSGIQSIGIACAGGIDTTRGTIATASPNMPGWDGVPLRDNIRERFGAPAFLVNDASAAALGEQRFGAGRGVNHLVLLTLGTGIGGGIIINGRLYLGARGAAAEIGHMTVAAEGPLCRCGNTGCLEMLASGTAVKRDAVARLRAGEKSFLSGMVAGKTEDLTTEMIGRAAARGDALARAVLERAAYYLGTGLVNIVNIFNPEMIVLGGGMSNMGDFFTEAARVTVAERAFKISADSVRIVTAELNNDAGVYGAAAYAVDSTAEGSL